MKREFDWDAFENYKLAVICDTEEKFNAFMKECEKRHLMWMPNTKATDGADYATMRKSCAFGVTIAYGGWGKYLSWCDGRWYAETGLTVCAYDEIQWETKPEPCGGDAVSWKLIIEGCGDTTTAKYIEGKRVVASGSVKRHCKDEHSPKSATLAVVEKVFSEEKKEPEKIGFTGRAVCKLGGDDLVVGKIYTFEDGHTVDDVGVERPIVFTNDTDSWIDKFFIRIVE